jgi:hypothetical protein
MISRIFRSFCTVASGAAILFLGGAGTARANIISFMNNTTVNINKTWTLKLPEFDTSLGQLTNVKIYYLSEIDLTTFKIQNNTSTKTNFHVDVNPTLNFSNTGNSADVFSEILNATSGTKLAVGETRTLATPAITNTDFLKPAAIGTSDRGLVAAVLKGTRLRDYKGSGQFKLSGSTLFCGDTPGITSCDGLPPAPLNVTALGRQTITVEVDYTFTPAPEPATMGLMGSALLGAALLRKRLARS